MVDPGLYMTKKSDVFFVTEPRGLPTAFKLFTGDYLLICSNRFFVLMVTYIV